MTEYQTTLTANTPIAVTIGNFDGIHLGHQRLLQEVRTMAQRLNCVPVMITFTPHTIAVVRPDVELRYLTTLAEKQTLAQQYGQVSDYIVIEFTPAVASQSAEAFMNDLCSHFSIKGIVVGEDFSLGHKRMGDIHFLRQYGQAHHIEVQAISLQEASHERISSTRIRTLVAEGRVSEANVLLGHPVLMGGIVQHGDQRGRLLGFPTANLRPDIHKLIPANGVYAVRATLNNQPGNADKEKTTSYNGVANIGVRPTFNGKERLVEVHLLDVNLNLYDSYILVEFIEYLRGEQRFSGIEALKSQISADVQKAQQILTSRSVSN